MKTASDGGNQVEEQLLRDSVGEFARKRIAPLAHELDEKEEFSYELTKEMGDLGLFGTFIDPRFGGHGLGYSAYLAAVEELAKVDGSQAATIAAHNSLGIGPLNDYGTDEQKRRFLPQLCTGTGLWAFGLTEASAGSDAQASKTRASYDTRSDEWVIEGSKLWITNSATSITKGITVQAITGERADGRPELSCFLVPIGAKGLHCVGMKKKMMWRAS
ncbi:MAG: acyl-CoA dehydrogenase family protein, partial [Oligoflexales bacterium]|nr:acyl-CoA dehydrogenase family protein [Oligoflexales bacterium]